MMSRQNVLLTMKATPAPVRASKGRPSPISHPLATDKTAFTVFSTASISLMCFPWFSLRAHACACVCVCVCWGMGMRSCVCETVSVWVRACVRAIAGVCLRMCICVYVSLRLSVCIYVVFLGFFFIIVYLQLRRVLALLLSFTNEERGGRRKPNVKLYSL